jgi:hypothetical protein
MPTPGLTMPVSAAASPRYGLRFIVITHEHDIGSLFDQVIDLWQEIEYGVRLTDHGQAPVILSCRLNL